MNESIFTPGKELYSIGRAVVDSSFHTQSGSEGFFSYFGNDVTYSIKRTICEEDFPRLAECMENVTAGVTQRTVIRMTGVNGLLRWILASVMLFSSDSGEKLYSIDFSDIFSLEGLSRRRERSLSEFRYI